MTRNTLQTAIAAALFASLALVGCKKNADQAATTPPPASEPAPTTPAPTEPAPAPAALAVTTVDLGNAVGADNRVAAPMSTFATTDTVHASVVTDGSGGTVATRWTFEDGQVVHEEDKIVPAGNQVTDFMITNPSGWPAGSYTLQVSVDGQVVETREFEVR